jgi:tRNA pseudouridine38-40 synthase
VRSVEEAPERFNARFDARSRTYQYLFIRRRTALWRRYLYPVGPSLDIAAMRREAAALVGEGDFAAFSSAEGGSGNTRCRVMAVDLADTPPVVALTVTADHFLHRMVRMIAGTLLEIGFGKPWRIEEILASRDRSRAGATLPPFALYLVKVTY